MICKISGSHGTTVMIHLRFLYFVYCSLVVLFTCGLLLLLRSLRKKAKTRENKWKWAKMGKVKKKKNENVLSGEVAYIEILSFLWNIPSRWIRILIGGFLSGGVYFFSNFHVRKITWEVDFTYNSNFSFIITYWQGKLEIIRPIWFSVLGLKFE